MATQSSSPRVHWQESETVLASTLRDSTPPGRARPAVLLVIPMHSSEPASNLEDMVACAFRHPPTTGGDSLRFDVLVVVSGTQPDTRGPDLARIVEAGTRHVAPTPPRVAVDFVHLEDDAYDRDNKLGRLSSYAGPNTAFYDIMADDGGVFERHTSRYAFVQVMETDCCTLRGGWLDELVAPMQAMPHIIISGSRVQATCYSAGEAGQCRSSQRIPPHLRFHVNGNAMYRTGPDLASLLASARHDLGNVVPFDMALYFVRRHNDSHAHANPRIYSIGADVAKEYMQDASYYGKANDVAFVHVPRRLRVAAVQAAASRVDVNRTTVAIVVPPGGGAPLPGYDLLANAHASLVQAGLRDQALFIALDRAGFERALALAPFRVGLAGEAGTSTALTAQLQLPAAASALGVAALFGDAGVSLLVIGPSGVAGDASLSLALARLNATDTDTLWLQDRAAAPLVTTGNNPPVLDVGAMVMPGTQRASAFLRAWASAVARGDQWTWTGAGVVAAVHGRCSMGAVASNSTASCSGLRTAYIPAEHFQAALAIHHPVWPAAARRAVAALVTADPDPATAAFHLRQAGMWRGNGSAPCSNYSAVAHGPLPIADLATTHASLASYASFLRFAGRHKLACGVLPGFAVLAAGGHVVPYDAALHGGQVARLAAQGMRVVPRVTDFGRLPYEAFVSPQPPDVATTRGGPAMPQGPRVVETAYHRHGLPDSIPALPSPASAATAHARSPGPAAGQPPAGHACAAFQLPGTTCLAPAVAADVDAAVQALHRLSTGPLLCVTDPHRTPAEAAVLGLEGRLGEVRDAVAAMMGASAKVASAKVANDTVASDKVASAKVANDTVASDKVASAKVAPTVLMTGRSWRTLPANAFSGGNVTADGLAVITLADLASGRQSADADMPFKSPDETAGLPPLVDLVEYALCQGHAASILDLGALLPPSPAPADLAVRVAAHIPPDTLAADLLALTTWLARPDRPSLGGRMLWARWPAADPAHPSNTVDGVLSALDVADAAGVPLVGLPATWTAAFRGKPAALHVLYSTARNLIPPSIAVMLDPVRAVDALKGWSSPVTATTHPASVDAVLADPRYAAALGAVARVLRVRGGAAHHAVPLHVAHRPQDGDPLSRGRIGSWRPLVRANKLGLIMDFGTGDNVTFVGVPA